MTIRFQGVGRILEHCAGRTLVRIEVVMRMPSRGWLGLIRALLALLPVTLALAGCAETLVERALSADEASRASIAGYGEIRTYLDAKLIESPRDAPDWRPTTKRGEINMLMISGGGAGGAFSVGVLSAWSAAKMRPQFDVVTGVSTGALIAPYAFLGPAYDDTLVHLYTSGIAEDLVQTKGVAGLFGSSLLKADPLRRMVEQFITPTILREIAVEHRKGRRLLVLTTNLDTQRAAVWNLGAIANSDRPDALKLFRDVLIASASIPGVYPAVMIKAESGGRQFEEMHSDGGSASQVLMIPQAFMTSTERPPLDKRQKIHFYVIINNTLMPEFARTPDETLPVIARAYSTFIKSQTQSELLAMYNYTRLIRASFHLAEIDEKVPYSMLDPFNTSYMRTVFRIGYSRLKAGTLWRDKPEFR